MRAMRLTGSSEVPLAEENVPQPKLSRGEELICVYAAGVTTTELSWYPTTHTRNGRERARPMPGHGFSGVIAALGEGVTGLHAGQKVYGMSDWFSDGALAEYCLTQPHCIAAKPSRLTHAEAASVPIGALTAWQGLWDRAGLQTGEGVLIHGGAGAVGIFAVQFARLRGAHVIATASNRNLNLVSELGADQVVDYRTDRFEENISTVDVVFDTVSGETLEWSWAILNPHGRMVTIGAGNEASADERVKQAFFIVEPNSRQLAVRLEICLRQDVSGPLWTPCCPSTKHPRLTQER